MSPQSIRIGTIRVVRWQAVLIAAILALPAQASTPFARSRTLTMRDICGACVAQRFAQCGRFLEGPTFDKAGILWVASVESGDLHKITPDGRCTKVANTGGSPRGLEFHKDGRLFGADAERGIFVLDPATGVISDYAREYQGRSFIGPNDLVFDKEGGLYFTDPGAKSTRSTVLAPTGAVYYVSPEPTKEVRQVAGGLAFPNGIALSTQENTISTAESAAKRILTIGLAAPGVPSWSEVAAYLPGDGLAVDAADNLYVAQPRGGGILVLDRDRLVVGSLTLPPEAGSRTTNLTFHDGYLYITEARENAVWRVEVRMEDTMPFRDR